MKKRIFNADKYTSGVKEGQIFRIAFNLTDVGTNTLIKIGFNNPISEGQTVLPSASFGNTSRYNAEGKELKLKDQPMETRYRQALWTWEQWVGRGETETHSKIVDISYKRRPRKFVPPPGVELSILRSQTGELFITSPVIQKADTSKVRTAHTINLFLEIFGDFTVIDVVGNPFITTEVKRLNWQILPEGKYPWKRTKELVDNILSNLSKGKKPVVEDRLQEISAYTPDFVAKGLAGFHGYLVFGFEAQNLFILENALYGNALYVFDRDWETLSKLTKADILTGNLQQERIVHNKDWKEKLKTILAPN